MKESLQRKIKQYSALAGTLVAAGNISGQSITYTDVDPDFVSDTSNTEGYIDLNQDGTSDFVITSYVDVGSGGAVDAVTVGVYGSQANALAGSAPSGYNYPFKMDVGDAIDASTTFLPDTAGGTMAFANGGSFPYGEFWSGDFTEGYLGLKFDNAGATHYGWARVAIGSPSAESFTLFDYALNLTADEAINAGQQGSTVSIKDLNLGEAKFIPMNKQVVVATNDNFNNGSLRVYDLAGKLIENESITSNNHVYEFKNLTQGVYLFTATFDEGAISRKIFINK
jgi:hypothetical protein